MVISSLRGRLFAGTAFFIIVTALVSGVLAFRWAFEEAIELQDAILLQVGALAAANDPSKLPSEGSVEEDARVLIDELPPQEGAGGKVGLGVPPPVPPEGLQTIERDGEGWRMLVRTRGDGSRIAVRQRTASRDEIARDSALRAVVPLGLLVPGLMLLTGLVIERSLRPLTALTARLDEERAGNLEKLPTAGIPIEVVPFVDSINRLLDRTAAMVDRQRLFVADAAHELRSPITALSVQADNLQREGLPADAAARMDVLRSGIRRTSHLLDQLMAFARYDEAPEGSKPAQTFDGIVKSVVADLFPRASRDSIDLGFTVIEPAAVRADPLDLAMVARNLIDNAIRYAREGGRVDVALICRGGEAELTIEDGGEGVPQDELDRLFQPFFRGSRRLGDGAGLGLSIVRRIVDRWGGTIEAKNARSGRGFSVVVRLPLAAVEESALREHGVAASDAMHHRSVR